MKTDNSRKEKSERRTSLKTSFWEKTILNGDNLNKQNKEKQFWVGSIIKCQNNRQTQSQTEASTKTKSNSGKEESEKNNYEKTYLKICNSGKETRKQISFWTQLKKEEANTNKINSINNIWQKPNMNTFQ